MEGESRAVHCLISLVPPMCLQHVCVVHFIPYIHVCGLLDWTYPSGVSGCLERRCGGPVAFGAGFISQGAPFTHHVMVESIKMARQVGLGLGRGERRVVRGRLG